MYQPSSATTDTPTFPIPPTVLLSLATAPFLLGLLAGKAAMELVQQTGQWSEELFRGDRLPLVGLDTPPADDMIR